MTPAGRKPVLSSSAFLFPESVDVLDGSFLAWEAADDRSAVTFQGGDDLLGAFLALATAEPSEMGQFMETYGVLELCQHGRPDRHPDHGRKSSDPYCGPTHSLDGRPGVASADVRRAALAFSAAREAAVALSARMLPDDKLWDAMARLQVWGMDGRPPRLTTWPIQDWPGGRAALASWVSHLLWDCGVRAVADWSRARLIVTPEADGLIGTLALVLAREIGQGDAYRCDVCGAAVDRVRPPRAGEGVYCKTPACRREQQRRNQAAWRARSKES